MKEIPASALVLNELIPGGAIWSGVVRRHTTLRLTDVEGGGNASALFYNREHLLERYNMADTLKAQHTGKLTAGHVLYSDMGRVLCSITRDTVGWHDPLGGHSDASLLERKYPASRFQEARNAFLRNGRDQFLIELGKWGLTARDLMANVNFFSRVDVDEEGQMSFSAGNSEPGDTVDLRAEMDVLVVLNTCPHPLNPASEYPLKPIRLDSFRTEPPGADDLCRTSCPENTRGFILTESYFRS